MIKNVIDQLSIVSPPLLLNYLMKRLIAARRRKLNRKYRNQRAAKLRWRCTHVANSFDRLGISGAALALLF
jgi:hypothetical protein